MKTYDLFTGFTMVLIMVFISGDQVHGQNKKETPFNIITYNIRMNTAADGENAWPLRKEKVTGLLKFHQADIFNVQEACRSRWMILLVLMPEFDHVGIGRDDGKRAGEHMAIFFRKSRFEKLDDGMFWLKRDTR